MGGPIPPWGLYRLLRGLEAKSVSGHLDLATSAGPVTLGLSKGRIFQAESEDSALGFGAYLVRARMVPDPAAAERLASTRRLVDAGVIRPEDASKLHGSYARSVLARILGLPATGWEFTPIPMLSGVVSDHPVDPFPELLRAVSRDGPLTELRQVVQRMLSGGPLVMAPDFEFALSQVKSHVGDVPALHVLRLGRTDGLTPEMQEHEDTVRILFALIVAGLLHAPATGSRPPSGASPAGHGPAAGTSSKPPSDASPRPPSPQVDRIPPPPPPPVSQASARKPPPERPQRPAWIGPQESIQLAGVSNPFEKELRNAWNELRNRNHYEALGVPIDARESAIQAAYLRARAQFARAKYEGVVPAESLEFLDRIHRHLDSVRDVLTDRVRRSSYNRQLGISTPSLDSRIVEIAEARALWRSGVEQMPARHPAEALSQFEAALRQDPNEPEYKVFQAFAILAMTPSANHLQQARGLAEDALRSEPDLVEGLVCLATIDRLEGRLDEARERIRHALSLDPEHAEARALKDLLRSRAAGPKMSFQKTRTSLVDRVVGLFKKGG